MKPIDLSKFHDCLANVRSREVRTFVECTPSCTARAFCAARCTTDAQLVVKLAAELASFFIFRNGFGLPLGQTLFMLRIFRVFSSRIHHRLFLPRCGSFDARQLLGPGQRCFHVVNVWSNTSPRAERPRHLSPTKES